MVTEGLTREEEKQLITLLNKMGGRMSPQLYNAVAKKFALTAIETVILRKRDADGVEVFLAERSLDDVYYAGQLHSPGSMLRASDSTYNDAFERVQRREISVRFSGEPQFVGCLFQHTERGSENGVIHVCELAGEPRYGGFYPVTDLPRNIIRHHVPIITEAARFYRKG